MNWADRHIPAILNAWYPGEQGGHAVADVLFGDYNPAGRLAISYPRHVGQLPVFYNHRSKSCREYVEGTADPLYPFGHGLSYTSFQYDRLRTEVKGDSVRVTVEVKNTGNRSGDEVIQLYLHDNQASVALPFMQLKAFRRITLAPEEKQEVEFVLTREQMKILNSKMKWVVEPGVFTVFVGASSRDIRQKVQYTL